MPFDRSTAGFRRQLKHQHAWWFEIPLLVVALALGTLVLDKVDYPELPEPAIAIGGPLLDSQSPAVSTAALQLIDRAIPDSNVIAVILSGVLVWCYALRHGVRKETAELNRRSAELEATIAARTAELRHANAEVAAYNSNLERLVAARTVEVVAVQDTAVFALAKLADSRDTETGQHLLRIRAFSQIIAEELASDSPYADQINGKFLDDLYRSSPLHDIGKVGIADAVLCKAGKLTAEEFDIMKRHTIIGANALDQIMFNSEHASFLAMASIIARFHHERFDGSGYFAGLAGQEIPLPARIVAIADVYDALTSKRVYKDAIDCEKSRQMIADESGKHFDPVIVEVFMRRFPAIVNAQNTLHDVAPNVVGAAAVLGDLLGAEMALANT